MKADVLKHFQENDPRVAEAVEELGLNIEIPVVDPKDYFSRLIRHIIYQQISGKAGDAINARFVGLFPKKGYTPELILETAHETLRGVGLSNSKASYVRNIADAVLSKALDLENIHSKADEEVIAELVQIKGVGRWTAEMFLMFTLGREDIFSHGDLGLRKGFQKLYGYKSEPKPATIDRKAKKWSPYKTYASLVLWRVLDNR